MLSTILELFLIIIFSMGASGYVTTAFYREPRGIKLTGRKKYGGKKPFCDVCKHPLDFLDFVPIVNWIKNKGKCPFCGVKVDRSFLLVEIASILPAIILYFLIGLTDDFILFYVLCCLLTLAGGIDLKHRFIPERILIAIFFIGALYRVMHDGSIFVLIQTLAVAVLLAIGFDRITGKMAKKGRYSHLKFFIAASPWLYPTSFVIFAVLNLMFAGFVKIYKKSKFIGFLQAVSLILLAVSYHLLFNL